MFPFCAGYQSKISFDWFFELAGGGVNGHFRLCAFPQYVGIVKLLRYDIEMTLRKISRIGSNLGWHETSGGRNLPIKLGFRPRCRSTIWLDSL